MNSRLLFRPMVGLLLGLSIAFLVIGLRCAPIMDGREAAETKENWQRTFLETHGKAMAAYAEEIRAGRVSPVTPNVSSYPVPIDFSKETGAFCIRHITKDENGYVYFEYDGWVNSSEAFVLQNGIRRPFLQSLVYLKYFETKATDERWFVCVYK